MASASVLPKSKALISIENVVASASVDQRIDLNEITRSFSDIEYHPDQFPGLVFRLKFPKTATLIFSSGKMVCTGSKSSEQAVKAVNMVVQKLEAGQNLNQERAQSSCTKYSSFRIIGR